MKCDTVLKSENADKYIACYWYMHSVQLFKSKGTGCDWVRVGSLV